MMMRVFGVWMWPEALLSAPAERVAARCARMGVTDLFFLVKELSGKVSWAGEAAPPVCGRDLLRELLDSAHARGIRVHAWLPATWDERWKALHPESGRCHYTRGRDNDLISLGDKGYRAHMIRLVRELCGRYEVDGLHLDYIRYNHLLYGWDAEDQRRYAAAGADMARLRELMEATFYGEGGETSCIFDALRDGDESARALAEVRRQDVRDFAGALTHAAREERKGLILSAALMPEGAYADTAFADLHYGQSYADAAELYDWALPMAYSRAYHQDARWVGQVALGTLDRGLRTVMGLQAYEDAAGEILRKDLEALGDLPVEGISLFREGTFVEAAPEGGELWLRNPLDKAVTALQACGRDIPLEEPLSPGEERRISLPWAPAGLRAFSGETELPLFLAPEAASATQAD